MISLIRGKLIEVDADKVIVDVGGVGYEIEASSSVLSSLPALGDEISLFSHFVVRDDAHLLYGFVSKDERALFRAYIRINGVGPKLAMALLASLTLADLHYAVDQKDAGALKNVPGVGNKTAERLLVELKNQLGELLNTAFVDLKYNEPLHSIPLAKDAEQALMALGYRQQESSAAVSAALTEVSEHNSLDLNELVRLALRNFIRE